MKRILWVSKHNPLVTQVAWLNQKFGQVEISQYSKPFDTAEQISRMFLDGGYDELVLVAPLSVFAKLIDLKIKPLWAEMAEVSPDLAEVAIPRKNGTMNYYKFETFKRVKAIILEYEDL